MITALFLSDTSTYALRAEKKTNKFIVNKMALYDTLIPMLTEENIDTLSVALESIAENLGSQGDKWYITLPSSLLSCRLDSISPLAGDDEEELSMSALKYLDQKLDENAYIPFVLQKNASNVDNYFFYTFAYVEKKIITTLVEAFRIVDMDLLYVEPAPLSVIRYINHAFEIESLELEVVFSSLEQILTNKYGTVVMKNDFNTTSDYQDEFSNISMLVSWRNDKFRTYKPERQIFITTEQGLENYLANAGLYVVDMPLLDDFIFLEDITDPIFPIFCGGLLLKDSKKVKRWWTNAVKQLFK